VTHVKILAHLSPLPLVYTEHGSYVSYIQLALHNTKCQLSDADIASILPVGKMNETMDEEDKETSHCKRKERKRSALKLKHEQQKYHSIILKTTLEQFIILRW
jgi:hypothetical protein